MKLLNTKIYVGILIKGGQVEQLIAYDRPDECRDNVVDSLNLDREGITHAGVWEISDEYFPNQDTCLVEDLTP